MISKLVWGIFAFTICLQSFVELEGICGDASTIRHWYYCDKFIECGENKTIVFQCPERSYFNPETLVCDFSMYHECVVESDVDDMLDQVSNLMDAELGILTTSSICNELTLGAKVQHPEHCNMFYHCSPSGAILFECPGNLLFCSRHNVCNWPQLVVCDESGGADGNDDDDDDDDDGGGGPVDGGDGICPPDCIPDKRCPIDCYIDLGTTLLPHPSKCDAFLQCRDGCACFVSCEQGLYWSTKLGRCVEKYRSDCEEVERPDCPDHDCIPYEGCPLEDDPNNPIRFPHPDRCDAFKKCHEGYACTVECPEGLEYNPETEVCDVPWGCVITTTVPTTENEEDDITTTPDITEPPVTTTPEITEPPITTTPGVTEPPVTTTPEATDPPMTTTAEITEPSITTTPVVTETTITTTLETTGPPDTTTPVVTDPPTTTTPEITESPITTPAVTEQPVTTTPENTEPPVTTTPEITGPPVTTEGPTCPICPPGVCKPDDRCPIMCNECEPVLLPHPDDCGMFLKCTHGFACEMHCPPGLHWSISANRCEWPEIAGCDESIPTPPNEDPPNQNCPVDARCPSSDPLEPKLLAHPYDCSKFVKCHSGNGCLMDCPAGLHWSIQQNRCEWPNRAGCDPTIPPEDDCPTCPCAPCLMKQERHPCVRNSVCAKHDNASLSLPYGNECDRFYKCLNGFACLLDCPRGTHYSAKWQRCEDPRFAGCAVY